MTIKNQIETQLKEAMKAQDEDRKRVYRMALASIKFVEKEQGKELADADVVGLLQKEIKIRIEQKEAAIKAGRDATLPELEKEIGLLEIFLPKQMSEDELIDIVKKAIAEAGASGPADMGKVMKVIMPLVKGKAANDAISRCVKEVLSEMSQ